MIEGFWDLSMEWSWFSFLLLWLFKMKYKSTRVIHRIIGVLLKEGSSTYISLRSVAMLWASQNIQVVTFTPGVGEVLMVLFSKRVILLVDNWWVTCCHCNCLFFMMMMRSTRSPPLNTSHMFTLPFYQGHGNDVDYFEPMMVSFSKNARAVHVSCGFNHTGAIYEYSEDWLMCHLQTAERHVAY